MNLYIIFIGAITFYFSVKFIRQQVTEIRNPNLYIDEDESLSEYYLSQIGILLGVLMIIGFTIYYIFFR